MSARKKIQNMTRIALYAVFITVCSWITIPLAVPITLQTFAIFFIIFFAGAKKAIASTLLYIALGAVGIPVFSGFGAGFGVLVGPTGGYIWGFLVAEALYFALYAIFGEKLNNIVPCFFASALALLACYALGACSVLIYSPNEQATYFSILKGSALLCTLPDIVKIIFAYYLSRYIKRIIA